MSVNALDEYWVPEHMKNYLMRRDFICRWITWSLGLGRGTAGWGRGAPSTTITIRMVFGRSYEVHRRSIHPAMRVCKEWGSLLLNEEVKVVCEDQKASDWINEFYRPRTS